MPAKPSGGGIRSVGACEHIAAAEEPALDARPARAWSAVRFRWAPTWYWSVAVAVIAYMCLLQLSNVSEFLYYQF